MGTLGGHSGCSHWSDSGCWMLGARLLCSSAGRGGLWVVLGGNRLHWDALAEQLLCAALKACAVVPPKHPELCKDAARSSRGPQCTGAAPIPGAGLPALTKAFLRLHKTDLWEPVPGVLALMMLDVMIKLPWAGAVLHPNGCCRCRASISPKCLREGGLGDTGTSRALCTLELGNQPPALLLETAAPWGGQEEGDDKGWASLELVFPISSTGPSPPWPGLGALEISPRAAA